MNINRTRLFKKCNIEKEDLNQLIEELKLKVAEKRNDYPHTGKDKISITQISCLGQTVRHFIISLDGYTQ